MKLIMTCNWQHVIDAIPFFCWGVLIFIAIYLALFRLCPLLLNNKHELKMRAEAFDKEKQWACFEGIKACTDEQLIKKNKELESQLATEKLKNELLEKQLETYKRFVKELNLEIKPKDNEKK